MKGNNEKASHELVGLSVGSELAMSCHSRWGTTCDRYAIAARHWASMDGRPNAGPHT